MFEASHVERVIRHLVRFGSSRADAEDLAQEALVIAWRKRGELDESRPLDAWLYGIARNVHRNHARSQRRRSMTDELPTTASGLEPAADVRDLADVVAFRDALGALPEAQQDIVILHELEEYTLKETAQLLAIPFDTAKDRLRRAREQLRGHVHGELPLAAAKERRSAAQVAKAAAPAVLVGVLGAVSRSAAAAGAGAASSGGAAVARASSAAFGSKLVFVGVLGTGIALGVAADRLIARGEPRAASSSRLAATHEASEPVASVADAGLAADAPAAPVLDAAHASRAASLPAPTTGTASNPEALLIERARVALRRGTPDEALRTLMSHERRFPDGQLAEERDVLLVEAYLADGNLKLARERLDHYNAAYPNGLHGQRAADAAAELAHRSPP